VFDRDSVELKEDALSKTLPPFRSCCFIRRLENTIPSDSFSGFAGLRALDFVESCRWDLEENSERGPGAPN
jgi:hypothetical protein